MVTKRASMIFPIGTTLLPLRDPQPSIEFIPGVKAPKKDTGPLDLLDELVPLVIKEKKEKEASMKGITAATSGYVTVRKKKFNKDQEAKFVNGAQAFFALVPKDTSGGGGWPTLFHERMIAQQDITSLSQLEGYVAVVQRWLDLVQPMDADNGSHRKVAVSLNGYLQTHRDDPDNALIGLELAEALNNSLTRHSTRLPSTTHGSVREPSRSASSSVIIIGTAGKDANVQPPSSPKPRTYTSMRVIPEMSIEKPQDSNRAPSFTTAIPMITTSSSLVQEFSVGDIAIAKYGQKYIFVRIGKVNVNNAQEVSYLVHIDPREAKPIPIEIDNLFHLEQKVLKNSMFSIRLMEKLVVSATDRFLNVYYNEMKNKADEFLLGVGHVDIPLLKSLFANEYSLKDYSRIKKQQAILKELLITADSGDYVKNFQNLAKEQVNQYIDKMGVTEFFPPTRSRVVQNLNLVAAAPSLRVDIQRYIGKVDAVLEKMTVERNLILKGKIKSDLTTWWLDLIDTSVQKFLTTQKYDFKAVPHEYIDEPPSSIEAVRKNLAILQTIIASLGDKSSPVHQLISTMHSEINPKLNQFQEKAKTILCDELGIPSSEFTIENAKQALAGRPQTEDRSFSNLILDLEYLDEMAFLENNPPREKGLKLGVVPISGIIVGYFYRYENEILTVLDVWSHLDPVQSPKSPPLPQPVKAADSPILTTMKTLSRTNLSVIGKKEISLFRMAELDAKTRQEKIAELKREKSVADFYGRGVRRSIYVPLTPASKEPLEKAEEEQDDDISDGDLTDEKDDPKRQQHYLQIQELERVRKEKEEEFTLIVDQFQQLQKQQTEMFSRLLKSHQAVAKSYQDSIAENLELSKSSMTNEAQNQRLRRKCTALKKKNRKLKTDLTKATMRQPRERRDQAFAVSIEPTSDPETHNATTSITLTSPSAPINVYQSGDDHPSSARVHSSSPVTTIDTNYKLNGDAHQPSNNAKVSPVKLEPGLYLEALRRSIEDEESIKSRPSPPLTISSHESSNALPRPIRPRSNSQGHQNQTPTQATVDNSNQLHAVATNMTLKKNSVPDLSAAPTVSNSPPPLSFSATLLSNLSPLASTPTDWEGFFLYAGIPDDAGKALAVYFNNNNLTFKQHLHTLNQTQLINNLGLKPVLALKILKSAKTLLPQQDSHSTKQT